MSERIVITGPGEYWTRDTEHGKVHIYAYAPISGLWLGETDHGTCSAWRSNGLHGPEIGDDDASCLDAVGPASEPHPEPVEVLALAGERTVSD